MRSSSSSERPSRRLYWGYLSPSVAARSWRLVFGFLYAVTILAWSATALTFGRIPALFTAGLLLVYPAFATLYHQASSDAVFATGLALWALLLARTMRSPSGWRFAALGAGIAALVLIRPANQVFLPLALMPLLLPVAWRQRIVVVGRLRRISTRTPRRLGAPQRRALRRRHRGTRRTGLGAVPHRVHGQPDDRPGERGSIPAACPT